MHMVACHVAMPHYRSSMVIGWQCQAQTKVSPGTGPIETGLALWNGTLQAVVGEVQADQALHALGPTVSQLCQPVVAEVQIYQNV